MNKTKNVLYTVHLSVIVAGVTYMLYITISLLPPSSKFVVLLSFALPVGGILLLWLLSVIANVRHPRNERNMDSLRDE